MLNDTPTLTDEKRGNDRSKDKIVTVEIGTPTSLDECERSISFLERDELSNVLVKRHYSGTKGKTNKSCPEARIPFSRNGL